MRVNTLTLLIGISAMLFCQVCVGAPKKKSDSESQKIVERIRSSPISERPAVVASICDSAQATVLAKVCADKQLAEFLPDRMLLVRAIAKERKSETAALISPYLDDPKPEIRRAAMLGLADLGFVSAGRFIVTSLRSEPPAVGARGTPESFVSYGALFTLAQVRPASAQAAVAEYKAILNNCKSFDDPSPPVTYRYVGNLEGTRGLQLSQYSIEIVPHSAAKTWFKSLRRIGLSDPDELEKALATETLAALSEADLVLGKVHLPIIRIVIKNDQTIGMGGSAAGHMAFGGPNGLTLNAKLFEDNDWRSTFRHELFHAIHLGMYENQPRWLSEGLAMGVESDRPVDWRRHPEVASLYSSGKSPVATVIGWKSGTSSDRSNEGAMYTLSHFVADGLRYSGFDCPTVRLQYLIVALQRGATDEEAIHVAYGLTTRELDARLFEFFQRGSPDSNPAAFSVEQSK